MIKNLLTLTILSLVATTLSAQEQSSGVIGNDTETQNLSRVSIEDVGSQQSPICHRMKNGVVKHNIQTAATE